MVRAAERVRGGAAARARVAKAGARAAGAKEVVASARAAAKARAAVVRVAEMIQRQWAEARLEAEARREETLEAGGLAAVALAAAARAGLPVVREVGLVAHRRPRK